MSDHADSLRLGDWCRIERDGGLLLYQFIISEGQMALLLSPTGEARVVRKDVIQP